MPNIEDGMRVRIAAFLPHAIERALHSYRVFQNFNAPTEAPEFKAHHDACKVAIAHLELLIKLAEWAHIPDEDLNDATLMGLLQSVQTEVKRNKKQER